MSVAEHRSPCYMMIIKCDLRSFEGALSAEEDQGMMTLFYFSILYKTVNILYCTWLRVGLNMLLN